jgi:hypothetical protein
MYVCLPKNEFWNLGFAYTRLLHIYILQYLQF